MHSLITWLVHLPTWAFLPLVMVTCIGAGDVLRRIFRLLDKKYRLQTASGDENHVVGYVFGVCGVVYAVVLAFVVVTAWQEKDHTEEVVLEEQNAIASLFTIFNSYEDTHSKPAPDAIRNVREDLRVYAHSMWADWYLLGRGEALALVRHDVTTEDLCGLNRKVPSWPRDGETAERAGGDVSAQAADCIAVDIGQWAPNTLFEQADYQASLRVLQSFLSSRAHRIHHSNERLPAIMWASLVLGAVVMLFFTFLFGEQSTVSQAIRTATLSAIIGIMFAQALVFDHPFIGPNRIDDSHWQDIARQFDKKLGNSFSP